MSIRHRLVKILLVFQHKLIGSYWSRLVSRCLSASHLSLSKEIVALVALALHDLLLRAPLAFFAIRLLFFLFLIKGLCGLQTLILAETVVV